MTDSNLDQFRDVMQRAHEHQKKIGQDVGKMDKLFHLEPKQRVVDRHGRNLLFWPVFRRQVARQYAASHGLRVNYQLNWVSIWEWILANWKTIIRTILFLVPFII